MESLEECYTVCGMGGWESCLVVQEKLQRYGLCSFTRWDPGPDFSDNGDQEFPSHWRFFFETNLKPAHR
jgi:hypothetical protein